MSQITGTDRWRLLLLSESRDDYVDPDNPERFTDAFVNWLDLSAAGSACVTSKPAAVRAACRRMLTGGTPALPESYATYVPRQLRRRDHLGPRPSPERADLGLNWAEHHARTGARLASKVPSVRRSGSAGVLLHLRSPGVLFAEAQDGAGLAVGQPPVTERRMRASSPGPPGMPWSIRLGVGVCR